MAKRKGKATDVVEEPTVEENTQDVSAEGSEAEVAPASLQLSDLQGLTRIVDVAMSRGAFRANEATTVGAIFDKLDAFVRHAVQTQAEAKGEEGSEDGNKDTE